MACTYMAPLIFWQLKRSRDGEEAFLSLSFDLSVIIYRKFINYKSIIRLLNVFTFTAARSS